MSCNLSASDLGAGMSTTVGRAGVCMCGVLIDNEKKPHVVQLVCVRSWGRHVYDGGSRECVCVYVCGVLMVNKKPYKPTSPPTRPRETKVKIVGPGVSSKKNMSRSLSASLHGAGMMSTTTAELPRRTL